MTRIRGLDALRGVAALAVVLFHYTTRYGQTFGHPAPLAFEFSAGFRGVDLFFMISGFVIFMTLENSRSARDFLVSRFSRLYPTYWAAVGLTCAVVAVFGLPGKDVSLRDGLLNLTMLPNLLQAKAVDGAYWTLEIELFFYAAMLTLYLFRQLKNIRPILVAWLALHVLVWYLNAHGTRTSYLFGHLLILDHIPLFGCGIMLYRLYGHAGEAKAKDVAVLCACLLTIMLVEPLGAWWTPAIGTIVILGLSKGRFAFLSSPALVFVGAISYPLYLLHENIGFVVMRWLYGMTSNSLLVIAITVIAVVGLATLLHEAVEMPALRFIRKTLIRPR